MKVFDLQADQEKLYFLCLEDWSSELDTAGPHKEEWYRKMQPRGLTDGLFIDEKQIGFGPPPSYEKIKRAIGKRVAKLRPAPDQP